MPAVAIESIPKLDFHWSEGTKGNSELSSPVFSARFTTYLVVPHDGFLTFTVVVDDDVKFTFDGQTCIHELYVNEVYNGGFVEYKCHTRELKAGQKYPIEVIYVQHGGPGYIHMSWSSVTMEKHMIPSRYFRLTA